MIKENYRAVKENITSVCDACGRKEEDVTLIAVSKTKPLKMLMEAYEAGARDFGENKVQELEEKIPNMPTDVRWHMIGHLQRNKVKFIVGKVYLIHSVDSLRLAEEISKEAVKKGVTVKILIEVNVAEEESKFGTTTEETTALIESVSKLPGVIIEGLMTIAPFTENPEENRKYFQKLKQLSVDIKTKNIDNVNMNVLSMGMTGDYLVAVQEGATYVRVGTGIFGERDYSKDRNKGQL
ncbi:MAG: YggS family pyridoxal phosphate-dependent enzyme [Acetatifactor sp.]